MPDDAGHKVDGVAPTVEGDPVIDVTSDANALVLTWSEPLDADSAPDQAQFAVDFDGTDNAVTAVDIDGSTLTLTLTTAATATTANVTVDYTKPETDFLTDAPGNAADGFTDRAVTVKSGPPTVSIAADADSVVEGEAAAFTLSRTGSAAAALTVNVSVTQEGDFISGARPTSVTFGAGDATVALEIATVDDDVGEDDGSIEVTVTSVPSGIEISQTAASAKVAVKDKDIWAKASVDRAAVTVNESAGTVTLGFSMRMEPNVTPFAMQVGASVCLDFKGHGAPQRGLRAHYRQRHVRRDRFRVGERAPGGAQDARRHDPQQPGALGGRRDVHVQVGALSLPSRVRQLSSTSTGTKTRTANRSRRSRSPRTRRGRCCRSSSTRRTSTRARRRR